MRSDGQPSAPRSLRGFSLAGSLRDGTKRFPAVAVISLVAFVLGLLITFEIIKDPFGFDLLDLLAGSVDGDNPSLVTRLASYLYAACPFGAIAAVVAQLHAERSGADDDHARREQMLAGGAALAVSLVLTAAGVQLDRSALFSLMRFGLMLAGLSWGVWLLMTPENERTLCPRLVCTGLYAGLIITVLFVGLAICILAAEVLVLVHGSPLDKLYEVAALVCYTLLAPNVLCGRLPRHDEELRTSRAYQVLVGYVILPLCLVLLGVLYLYIGKIVATHTMPSGEMNWFGSFALLVYICLWLGLRDMEWSPAQKFVRWGWALLVPVVATQMVGVAIRFQAYGLTTARYAGMLCLAVGVVALVMGALDRSPRGLFALVALVALVGTVSPANVLDVPNLEQASRLTGALSSAGMIGEDGKSVPAADASAVSEAAKVQIESSWDYLCYADEGYFSNELVDDLRGRASNQGFEQIFGFERPDQEDESGRDDWHSISYQADEGSFEISGFSRAYDLDAASEGSTYDIDPQDGYVLRLAWDDGTKLEVSLEGLVEKLPADISNESMSVKLPAEDLRVDAGDGRVLALSLVALDVEGGEPALLMVEGLLLVP